MARIATILFWLGIVGLIDGSLGLLFQEKWQKMVGNRNIQKIALIEVSVAWGLLILHYVLRFSVGM